MPRRGAGARWPGRRAVPISARPPPSASATGRSPTPGRAVCCRGCRSPSGSASRSISPPSASPPGGRGSRSPLVCACSRSSRAAGRSRSRWRSACAAVAAGFAVATLKTVQVAHPVLARPAGNVADRGLRRGARGARAHRPHRGARTVARRRAHRAEARARARLGEEGHGAAGRRLCDVPRAAQSAARAAAARRLRLRPRSLFPGHRRDRLRARRDQASPSRRSPPGLWLRYAAIVQGIRDAIDARIRAALPGDKGAIASALITGKRDAISAPVNDAMYISSLAHVLSISGYHMALVAGVVFFVLRALLALFAGARQRPPDQEMGRGRRADRGVRLSAAVRRRGRDPALLHHDGDRADRRDGRPAGADACARSRSRPSACCCSRRSRSCIRASRCRLRRRWR